MDKQMLGIINAGEENRKLKDLVRSRSLSALPVGGRYRTVDFMLSNMVNAGIKNVGLLTRRNYDSLLSHVNSGKDWGLNKNVEDYISSHHILMMHLHPENTQVLWMDFVEHLDF